MRALVNAPPPASRLTAYDSGSGWFATPFPYGSFIRSTLPVLLALSKTIVFRTLFGNLDLSSPRLRRCPCQHDGQLSASPLVELLSEHTAPELVYLESK